MPRCSVLLWSSEIYAVIALLVIMGELICGTWSFDVLIDMHGSAFCREGVCPLASAHMAINADNHLLTCGSCNLHSKTPFPCHTATA